MEQLPRFCLWIFLLEVGEKGGVREVLQTGRVVGHAISASWYEETVMAIAVLALVHAGVIAEMGSWSVAGDRTFVHPGHGGGVVRAAG